MFPHGISCASDWIAQFEATKSINLLKIHSAAIHLCAAVLSDYKACDADPTQGYVRQPVLFGHVHIAKTGGTTLNQNLSLQFERVCGHKGYSYDAIQLNRRVADGRISRNISGGPNHTMFDRQRVHISFMDEIGYEDCDWISHETHWRVWRSLQKSTGIPIVLHMPCRDPVDHVLSQCNHRGMTISCEEDIVGQISRCLLGMNRFSLQLEHVPNIHLRCFDSRASYNGRYVEFMRTKLQRRRIVDDYAQRYTNKARKREHECIWQNETLIRQVRSHLIATVEYYKFCDRCLGSHHDLFPEMDVTSKYVEVMSQSKDVASNADKHQDSVLFEGAEDHRHGDHHPPVSIRVDSTPLVSRHRASDGGRGQWPTRGTMELTFYLQGAVPHFAYRIVVQEIDASNHQVVRQQEETEVVMGEDASSQPVTVTFWILDAEKSAYRFVIAVWDAYEGLTAEEGLLARRDLTVSLHKGALHRYRL